MGESGAFPRLAAPELEHDDWLRARCTSQRSAKAKSILDALDDADDDLGQRIVGEPFQIIRRIDYGFVAAGDQIVEADSAIVTEFKECVDQTTALRHDRNAACSDGILICA